MNVGNTERYLSMAAGGALALLALSRRTVPSLLGGLVGASLLYRGTTGHCALYQRLGVDTARHEGGEPERAADQVDESSDLSFPASDAPAWTPTTSVQR